VNLVETARVAQAGAQLEEATFGLLGAWMPSVPEPEAKVLIAEHALHHAWHASLWRALIPEAIGLVVAAIEGGEGPFARELALVEALAGEAFEGTFERLRAVHGLFGQLRREAYGTLLESLTSASDGPVIRALTLISADQERDRNAAFKVRMKLAPHAGGGSLAYAGDGGVGDSPGGGD
jgi:hypothetical protein